MFTHYSSFCSPSTSYLINYKIQFKMYEALDNYTEESEYLISSGLGVWVVSNIITTTTRIAAIAETLFVGLDALFSTPFSNSRLVDVKFGLYEIFIHTPKNILRTTCIPIEFFLVVTFILFEPKSFTMKMRECMRVNLFHSLNGTIHSDQHEKDLNAVSGVVKPKFMKWQNRMYKRLQAKNNIEEIQ